MLRMLGAATSRRKVRDERHPSLFAVESPGTEIHWQPVYADFHKLPVAGPEEIGSPVPCPPLSNGPRNHWHGQGSQHPLLVSTAEFSCTTGVRHRSALARRLQRSLQLLDISSHSGRPNRHSTPDMQRTRA